MKKPFKAYDIRGIYPRDINEDFALDLGKAVGTFFKGKEIVVGRDGRSSGDALHEKLVEGIISTGKNVINIGLVSTPQFYFSLYTSEFDGGVMITASHNTKEYNGFKIREANALPVFKEHDLPKIEAIFESKKFNVAEEKGKIIEKDIQDEYAEFFKKLSKPLSKKFTILADSGNGMGIMEIKTLKKIFEDKIEIDILYEDIDGEFPNHECNPIIEENIIEISKRVKEDKYDFGVAFDGDADRAVFLGKDGNMIPADLITLIIGEFYAKKGEVVGFEVRTTRLVRTELEKKGIQGELFPSGAVYIAEHMKKYKAAFAGEKSGHYLFRELEYTDSSLFTVMNMLERLDSEGKTLEEITKPLLEKYINSGEVNYEVENANQTIEKIKSEFKKEAEKILEIDGLSIYGKTYFFNIRKSNTEPLIRLTIEGDSEEIMKNLQERIEKIIKN